jgi:hypothetical protein
MKFFFILSVIFTTSCTTIYKNKNVEGLFFPSVKGESLSDKEILIPEDFKGKKVVLLLGFKQDSQFDIDRWLIGIDVKKIKIKVYELPVIKGAFPRMFKTKINGGMKNGIPKEMWGAVVTVYEDGEKVQMFTGNEKPNNSRVMLIDENGKIRYFHDEGFSVSALNRLSDSIK